MRTLIFLLTINFSLLGQPCPDDINHTNNSVNTVTAYIYENGVLVDSIECNLAGGSGNINCDLDTIDTGYISLGSPYEDCIYGTDGNLSPSLPVELAYFDIAKSDGVIIAEWATHTEGNNNYFILEGSYSGKDWKVIHKVGGVGHSYTLVEYQEYVGPYKYYRLSQYDYNGDFDVLGIRYGFGEATVNLVKTIDLTGRVVGSDYKGVVIDIFSDNTTRRRFQ